MSLIPLIRFSAFKRRALLAVSISLNGEIISPYSRYAKKGLVYIIIISPLSRQPSSYSECTKANTCLFYDVRLVPLNKYIFPCRCTRLYSLLNLLDPWLSYYRVSCLTYS